MWHAEVSDDGPDDEVLRRMQRPDNELPVALPFNRLLARTDDVAVGLVGLQVFTTGLSFDLAVRVRPSAAARGGWSLHDLFWAASARDGTAFLLGVEFADGRRLTALRADADGIVLHQAGGGGGDAAVDQAWWLSALPPDGPLRFVVRCDTLGIAETVTELDGTAVRAAAADVVTLWPWERPPAHRDGPGRAGPDLPPDSWFASS
jgi:hypothetical protein